MLSFCNFLRDRTRKTRRYLQVLGKLVPRPFLALRHFSFSLPGDGVLALHLTLKREATLCPNI